MTGAVFQFKWGKRDDAAHTITLNGAMTEAHARPMCEGLIRQMRPGVSWKLVYGGTGVVRHGVGPNVPWLGVSV